MTDTELLAKAGPAIIVLRSDRRHAIRAAHAELGSAGVVTAVTDRGVRSWPAHELALIKWLTPA